MSHYRKINGSDSDNASLKRLLLLERAINSTSEMVLITDKNGRVEFVNDSFVAKTGFSRNEILGRNPRLLQSGHHPRHFYAHLWSVILAGRTWEGDIINRRKNGSVYPERMRITPVLGEDGEIEHFVAVKEDVGARRSAEADEASARFYFEQLVDTLPLPVFAKDSFGVYTFCNTGFEELIGVRKDQILGHTVREFSAPEHAGRHMEVDELLLNYGGKQIYDVSYQDDDGSTRYYRFHKATVRGPSNEIIGLVGVVDPNPRDPEPEQTEARKGAQSIRSVEEVITFLNHEIHTPLAGIQTIAEILEQPETSVDERQDLFRLIGEESRRLSRTLLNALQIAQILTGSFPWDWQTVRLSDLCLGVAKLFNSRKGCDEHLEFRYAIPPGEVSILGDPESLIRMLSQLLDNAMKYTQSGSVAFSLDLVERAGATLARIEIRDTGPGIHPEILEKLDQPFSLSAGLLGEAQAHGSGLALTLSKKIVRAHGGYWEIDSDAQNGTAIRIYLPQNQESPVIEA